MHRLAASLNAFDTIKYFNPHRRLNTANDTTSIGQHQPVRNMFLHILLTNPLQSAILKSRRHIERI